MIKTTIIAFSQQGAQINRLLVNSLGSDFMVKGYYHEDYPELTLNKLCLSAFSERAFQESRLIIYIGALGIATRAIAPYLRGKSSDPAVLVIDDRAQFVIPLLSGHLGQANEYALQISELLHAIPVITTATDINKVFAVDSFALKNDLLIDDTKKIKLISTRLLNQKKIGFVSDYPGPLPDFIDNEAEVGIYLGERNYEPFEVTMKLIPKKYVVGVGLRKGKSIEELEEFFLETLQQLGIDYRLVSTVVSIDLKKAEPALLALINKYRYSFVTYSSEQLSEVNGEYTSSAFVKSVTGVDNVCERSVARYAGYENIILRKQSKDGMTIALAKKDFTYEV